MTRTGSEGCVKGRHQETAAAELMVRARPLAAKSPEEVMDSRDTGLDTIDARGTKKTTGVDALSPPALIPQQGEAREQDSRSDDVGAVHGHNRIGGGGAAEEAAQVGVKATASDGHGRVSVGDDGGQGNGRGREGHELCVRCLRWISGCAGAARVCRYHDGLFNSESTARPRTITPLAPHKIAVFVDFQRLQVMFHAPQPVGESGCTNPHLFAIEGRTSAACGFASISHYEVLVDGGLSGGLRIEASHIDATSHLDLRGVFSQPEAPASANTASACARDEQDEQVFLDQRALDVQDVHPPFASAAHVHDSGRPHWVDTTHVIDMPTTQGAGVLAARVGQAAQRVLTSGAAAGLRHSIRVISRTKQDAARPFAGWRGDESEEIFFTGVGHFVCSCVLFTLSECD